MSSDPYETVKKVIGTRCSVRTFRPDPISDEDVREILWAGIRAPTASAGEQWYFIVVKDEEKRKKVYDLILEAQHIYLEKMLLDRWSQEKIDRYFEEVKVKKVYWAPVYIIAYLDFRRRLCVKEYEEIENLWALQSISTALENMILAAWAKGIGSVWLGVPVLKEEEFDKLLGPSPGTKLVGGLALGRPAGETSPTKRKAVEEVTRFV
jgi:nitroreductase